MNNETWDIVSNAERTASDMGDYYYVWIPMTDIEQKVFAPNIMNASWRIRVNK